MPRRTAVVTGGAGFIGSALVRRLVREPDVRVVVVDALTYAGNLESLAPIAEAANFTFVQADIRDPQAMASVFAEYDPDTVYHLAAESHVDRSIDAPAAFVETNVGGTSVLLDAAQRAWRAADSARREARRFIHVSTDEVFGSLGASGRFSECTPYDPRSPYSASKAASDHLARAWYHTYGLPVIVTNCSNNFGPYQFPEKLIPVVVRAALAWEPVPVYGRGENIRDWLFVDDHVDALLRVAARGRVGETYAIGGDNERRNIDLVRAVCEVLDELQPDARGARTQLITFVADRPGHDLRYAIDSTRIRTELGWAPMHPFDDALRTTVRWYLDNEVWVNRVMSGAYRGERLGLGRAS